MIVIDLIITKIFAAGACNSMVIARLSVIKITCLLPRARLMAKTNNSAATQMNQALPAIRLRNSIYPLV
jgi:hypothetical protein